MLVLPKSENVEISKFQTRISAEQKSLKKICSIRFLIISISNSSRRQNNHLRIFATFVLSTEHPVFRSRSRHQYGHLRYVMTGQGLWALLLERTQARSTAGASACRLTRLGPQQSLF